MKKYCKFSTTLLTILSVFGFMDANIHLKPPIKETSPRSVSVMKKHETQSQCAHRLRVVSELGNNRGKPDDYPLTDDEFECLTNLNLIENYNYFLLNPKHSNHLPGSVLGTCTTVAAQLLVGYHNYYSDRRIIPETSGNISFLAEDYGNINYNPTIEREPVANQGCEKIGTLDAFFNKLIDLNSNINNPINSGQDMPSVVNSVKAFFDNYSEPTIRDNLNISTELYNEAEVNFELNNNRPVVLGYGSLIPFDFHVFIAYGKAELDGVTGYLVHYGWGASSTRYFAKESAIAFQMRMSVGTPQTFTETGNVVADIYREQKCNTTGVSKLAPLFSTTPISGGQSISLANGNILLKQGTSLNILSSLNGGNVVKLANEAFKDQARLVEINIPSTVISVGTNALFNTGGAIINLIDRNSAPQTFSYNWNPSNNPVKLNGVTCNHTNQTLVSLNDTKHGMQCPTCKTTTNIENHNHTYTWRSKTRHRATCACGRNVLEGHFVSSSNPSTCMLCGGPADTGFIGPFGDASSPLWNTNYVVEYFSNGSYLLSNGVYVISDADLDAFNSGTLDIPKNNEEIYNYCC